MNEVGPAGHLHGRERRGGSVTEVLSLPIGKVDPDPDNPRSNLGDLRELAASIVEHGVLEPVLVREHPSRKGRWLIVAGHRRHAAAAKAGSKTIPALVTVLDATEAAILQLVENLQREDLSPVDEANAFKRLLDLGLKQVDIARRVSRTKSHVSKRLTLLDLPKQALDLVAKGSLRLDDAYQLAATLKIEGVDREGLLETIADTVTAMAEEDFGSLAHEIRQEAELAGHRLAESRFAAEMTALGYSRLSDIDRQIGGLARVDRWGLQVDVEAHKTEPCARFDVTFHWANNKQRVCEPRWWCVEPNRHNASGPSQVKLAAGQDVSADDGHRRNAADRAREKAKAIRLEQAAAALVTVDHPELVYHQAVLLLIDTMNSVQLTTANDLLSATPFSKLHRKLNQSAGHKIRKAALLDLFPIDPPRVALAAAVAFAESFEYSWRDSKTDFRYQFLDLLARHGQGLLEGDPDRELEAVPA